MPSTRPWLREPLDRIRQVTLLSRPCTPWPSCSPPTTWRGGAGGPGARPAGRRGARPAAAAGGGGVGGLGVGLLGAVLEQVGYGSGSPAAAALYRVRSNGRS